MKQNIIYGLFEPNELGNKLRYIGQSAIGLERAYQHKKKSNLNAKNHKVHWIKSLISKNLIYEAKILLDLGTFSDNKERDFKLNEEEIRLIQYHKSIGDNLTNSTEGGEGTRGNILSQDTKNIIGQKQKEHIEKYGLNEGFKKLIQPKPKKEINGIIHKHCSDCDTYKPITEYHKNKDAFDKFKSICKTCSNLRTKQYYDSSYVTLSEEQLQQSYIDRKEAMSNGIKARYEADPTYRERNSKAKSKSIIGTNVSDPTKTIEFPSALVAKKEAGYCNGYIGSSIKTGKPYKGYHWSFKK